MTTSGFCSEEGTAQNNSIEIKCKLTPLALQERKETAITALKQQMLDQKELPNGYAFKFPGTDEVLDQLMEFIKTERACCNFFIFELSISGDKSETWLKLTGATEVKSFITAELGY